jgi:glucose/mannose transport system permease protein
MSVSRKKGLDYWLPKLVVSPTLVIALIFFYGFILWTTIISFTNSSFLPSYDFVGFEQYVRLFLNPRWLNAMGNLLIFCVLFIGI